MAEGKCKYRGCKLDLNIYPSGDPERCLFHAAKDKKGKGPNEFNKLFSKFVKEGNYKFRGFIFPWEFDEKGTVGQPAQPYDFSHAKFFGNARFFNWNFGYILFFEYVTFYKSIHFDWCKFEGDTTFRRNKFMGNVSFFNMSFDRECWFVECIFKENLGFLFTTFKHSFIFINNEIHQSIDFGRLNFGPNTEVIFRDIKFRLPNNLNKNAKFPKIQFYNIQFNELITRFENIMYDNNLLAKPLILFELMSIVV